MGFGVWLLARGLPPETFFVGDPGVKLIAARQARNHPGRALEMPVPIIGGQAAPFVEPFFVIHDEHAHAVTSQLFPVLSAPLIAALGPRGVYVLPAIGLLTAIAAWAWIGVLLDRRRRAVVVLVAAAFATPWLFYGLEFWEHAPALGVSGLGTALLVAGATKSGGTRLSNLGGAGVLFGVSVLLRPEALWYVTGVLIASAFRRVDLRWRDLAVVILGLSAAVAPSIVYAAAHFGAAGDPHIAGHAALLGQDYLAVRLQLLRGWFVRPSTVNAWFVAPGILLALVPRGGADQPDGRSFLLSVSAITVLLVVLTAPNDGGGQWGPRYLLFAYGPLTVLAADTAEAWAKRALAGVLVIALLTAGSLWMQRMSYRQLRSTKQTYQRVLDFVRREAPPASYVITDLWWLDQVAAAATAERSFLYAPDHGSYTTILDRMERAGVPAVTVFGSRDESFPRAADGHSCFVAGGKREIPERSLFAVRLTNGCTAPSVPNPPATP